MSHRRIDVPTSCLHVMTASTESLKRHHVTRVHHFSLGPSGTFVALITNWALCHMDLSGFVFALNTRLDSIGLLPVGMLVAVAANVSFHKMELHSSRIASFQYSF